MGIDGHLAGIPKDVLASGAQADSKGEPLAMKTYRTGELGDKFTNPCYCPSPYEHSKHMLSQNRIPGSSDSFSVVNRNQITTSTMSAALWSGGRIHPKLNNANGRFQHMTPPIAGSHCAQCGEIGLVISQVAFEISCRA